MSDLTIYILISTGITILVFFACLRLYKNLKAQPLNPSLLIHETITDMMEISNKYKEVEDRLEIINRMTKEGIWGIAARDIQCFRNNLDDTIQSLQEYQIHKMPKFVSMGSRSGRIQHDPDIIADKH